MDVIRTIESHREAGGIGRAAKFEHQVSTAKGGRVVEIESKEAAKMHLDGELLFGCPFDTP